jgi:polyhydroxyalkanoate synthesis regulator phasin
MQIDATEDRKRGRWRRMWAYTVSVLEAMDFDPMEYTESRISRLEQEVVALKNERSKQYDLSVPR